VIERRELEPVRLSDGQVRRTTVVMGEPCEPGTQQQLHQQREILRLLYDDGHHLLACGPERWQVLEIRHDGSRWVARASAVVGISDDEEDE